MPTPNICPCGRPIEPYARFCDACGRSLAATGETQRLPPPLGWIDGHWSWDEDDLTKVAFVPWHGERFNAADV